MRRAEARAEEGCSCPWIVRSALVGILVAMSNFGLAVGDEPKTSKQKSKPSQRVVQLFNGKDLKGWRVVEAHEFQRHGRVEVKDGSLLLAEGSPMTGVSCTMKLPRNNYELTLDAKRTGGMDFFCGLTFPVDKSHCTLILGGWGGGLTGLSNVDGYAAVENETTGYSEFKMNRWYRVRLKVTPGQIEVWIEKKQIISLAAKDRKFTIWWEQEPVRPLGIATYQTSGAIRNVRLTHLDPSGK